MTTIQYRAFTALLFALLCFPAPLLAQTGIAGIVTDDTGGSLPGVTVTLTGETVMGEHVGVTDAAGSYRFEMQTPGQVQLRFELAGFGALVVEKISVRAGITTTTNATLRVATLKETITVVGANPVVDRESSQVGVNFSTEMLQSLPNARDIWVVLSQSPGVSMARFDVGGSSAGVQTGYTSYGFGGQNFVGLDGIMTTEGTGGSIVYMDYGSFGEVQIVGAGKSADIAVPGTYINTVVKTGTNRFRGQMFADWEHESFQGDNLSDELRAQGVLSGDRITRYNDFNWQLGGPIVRDRLWFFYSGRNQHIGVQAIGFTDDAGNVAPFYTDLGNHGVKLNSRIREAHELTYFGSYNYKYQPFRGGGGGGGGGEGRYFTTSSAGNQEMPTPAQKVQWTTTAIPESTFDLSLNYVGQDFSILRRVDEVSRRDLDTQLVRGGYSGVTPGFTGTSDISIPFSWLRNRTHLNANWSWFTDRLGGGSHTVKGGYVFIFEEFKFPQYGTFDHAVYYYRNNFQTPAFVETYDTPLETINRLRQHSLFLNDRWTAGRHLTLNLGVRLDRYTNYYPAQGNPGTGPFAKAFEVPARTLPTLSDWVPRLSAIYDVFGDGRTAVKASYGRYSYNPGVTLASQVNPVARTQTRYRWDGTLPFVPNPADIVSVVGGRQRDLAPDFRNSYVDEWTVGYDQQLMAEWLVRFNIVRRYDKDRSQLINAAQPFDAFNMPVAVRDPGPDGRVGTADDREITLFGLDRALLGRFDGVLMNTPGYSNNYLSYDMQVSKPLSKGFDLLGSATANRIQQWPAGVPQNPNDAAFSNYEDYWQWSAKLMGTYHAPWALSLSSVLKSQSGSPYGRQFRNPSGTLTQGTITVFADPVSTYKYPATTLWDVRASRSFSTGRGDLEVMLDVFNVLNRGTVTAVNTLTGPNFNRQIIRILNPRIAKIGAKFSF